MSRLIMCLKCKDYLCEHLLGSSRYMLTWRELTILRLLVDPNFKGSYKTIAFNLGITHGTTKSYVARLCRKLGVSGYIGLVLWTVAHASRLGMDLPVPSQFPYPDHKFSR